MYAALKGSIDGGLDIPAKDDVFPPEERLTGQHLTDKGAAKDFATIKAKLTS